MAIAPTVERYLDLNQVAYDLVVHPKTSSSRESAQAAHVPEDHIAKAVVLRDAQGLVMAVIPGNHWLRLHSLREMLNRALELAEEAQIDPLFADCRPGAIPPLGQAYGMETVLDEAFAMLAEVYFEAGDHEHLVRVDGEDFRRLTSGLRRGFFSHAH